MKPAAFSLGAGLALPTLDQHVHSSYVVSGQDAISRPLAKAMLEAGLITDADFRPGPRAKLVDVFQDLNEKTLAERALSRWWRAQTASLRLFSFALHVQRLDEMRDFPDHLWFCLTQKGDVPQISLALQVEALERELEGFGQTVVALLQDALRHLPEAWTPWKAWDYATYIYWAGHGSEEEYIEDRLAYGDHASREALLADEDVVTRAQILGSMPEWMLRPQRVHSRAKLERAARSTLGKNVLAACDRLHAAACATRPDWDIANMSDLREHLDVTSTSDCLLLRWYEDDSAARIADDAYEEVYNNGNACEFLRAAPVATTPEGITDYMRRMEGMLRLAAATEPLLMLLGEAEHLQVRV